MAGYRLVAWGLVMVAGATAAGLGLLSRASRPDESQYVYMWGCSLLFISAVMFVVDYLRSWGRDKA